MTLRLPQSHANRGRALERTVEASQSLIVVTKVPHGMKYLRGGKTVGVKSLVDFVGTVRATGRSIYFDAKTSADPHRFDIGDRTHFTEYQRQFLIRMGGAGAIAGLLVESTARGEFLWLNWQRISLWVDAPSIRWDDPMWLRLGDNKHAVDFGAVVGNQQKGM